MKENNTPFATPILAHSRIFNVKILAARQDRKKYARKSEYTLWATYKDDYFRYNDIISLGINNYQFRITNINHDRKEMQLTSVNLEKKDTKFLGEHPCYIIFSVFGQSLGQRDFQC